MRIAELLCDLLLGPWTNENNSVSSERRTSQHWSCERLLTVDEVGVVAALPQLHHGVEEVRDAGSSAPSSSASSSRTSLGQEGEVLFQNGSVVFLLDVGQLHLRAIVETVNRVFTLARRSLLLQWSLLELKTPC